MSSQREPMWFCHECNAEMRPLMMPDPHCASCRGSFVEKMEDPNNDPREFHHAEPTGLGDVGLGALGLLASINEILRSTSPTRRDTTDPRPASPTRDQPESVLRSGFRFEFSSPSNQRTIIFGGPPTMNGTRSDSNSQPPSGSPPPVPRLSDFLRQSSASSDGSNGPAGSRELSIPGQLMAQYLLAMLGGTTRGGPNLFGPPNLFGTEEGGAGPGGGRWGDYVFTQDALDEIITQMMEASNASRPVPATEEVMEKLPRERIREGSPLLESDCAVCKEQFSAHAEEADEQMVVTLPCNHPFHQGCIIPWLKSSGTCPVCRYALVPQPNSHANGHAQASGSTSPGRPSSESRSPTWHRPRSPTRESPRVSASAQELPRPDAQESSSTPAAEPPHPPVQPHTPAHAESDSRSTTRESASSQDSPPRNSSAGSRASGFFGTLLSHGLEALRHGGEVIRHAGRSESPQRSRSFASAPSAGTNSSSQAASPTQERDQPPGRATSPRRRGENGGGARYEQ